ncbi:hypothetical protein A2963_00280 [Candidatus Roizmanbacteria bacterium RIFCSPLOWO2_01_FULL_40_13]|nr:MAG: hypothetical protein A2963_00280 [Candidatus Roizmanbacteria bacterium RIFCSPLOWO2_01_FULL_40_13]
MTITSDALISVIVPAYNEGKYLSKCLESITNQTYKNFELIVIDNNSTDNTSEIAKKYGARVVFEKKQGMIQARERGFSEAKGVILVRTDADTIVPENWLETILLEFNNHSNAIALTGPIFKYGNLFSTFGVIYSTLAAKFFYRIVIGQNSLLGPNMAFKKSDWKKIKVCNDETGVLEDLDISYHLSKLGKIFFLPNLQVISSTRKIEENILKGIYLYCFKYFIRYIKTIRHH